MFNEEVISRAEVNRKVLCEIKATQERFFGPVVTNENLERLETIGTMEEK